MENTGTAPAPASASASATEPAGGDDQRARAAARGLGLAVLVAAVLVSGVFITFLGPLFAIACDTCEDGVRGTLAYGDALIAVARYGVPLATFATLAGMVASRRPGRVGGFGLGAQWSLFVVVVALGQLPA
ncbi:hypothetical protein [Streptomyces buecherae]|uniref:hypothetical protein n=1 Tax=Streptomyces buecherae TaxID=2763006 RepID=UPI0037AEB18B